MTPDDRPARRFVAQRIGTAIQAGLPRATLERKLAEAKRTVALMESLRERAIGRRDQIAIELVGDGE